jgi:titin
VAGKEAILLEPQHEESLGKIEYLENLQKFVKPEIPDYEPTAPQFIEQLPGDFGEVEEGEPLHLECKVEPVGDNQLKVHWLRNGQPLPHGKKNNRLRIEMNF